MITQFIIPAIAVIVLYVAVKILNKKGIINSYHAITGERNLIVAALIILLSVTSLSKESQKDKYITIGLAALLVTYFIYKYFKTRKTA